MKTLAAFRASLAAPAPPPTVGPALEALWWLARGNWDSAHRCVQGHEGEADSDWVHAHLHRQEGDLDNAGYWYRRAGKPASKASLPEEWDEIATALLASR
jgi:hypothetical protein